MATIRKHSGGDYYLSKKTSCKVEREWWLVKFGTYSGCVTVGTITFPGKFVGKKVRFKVEVIEDDEK